MRKRRSQDIQREGYRNKEDHAVTLEKLFENENGVAFVHVTYKDKKGMRYGSAQTIHHEGLEGREYVLNRSGLLPWIIHIEFTDVVYKVGTKMPSLYKYGRR